MAYHAVKEVDTYACSKYSFRAVHRANFRARKSLLNCYPSDVCKNQVPVMLLKCGISVHCVTLFHSSAQITIRAAPTAAAITAVDNAAAQERPQSHRAGLGPSPTGQPTTAVPGSLEAALSARESPDIIGESTIGGGQLNTWKEEEGGSEVDGSQIR